MECAVVSSNTVVCVQHSLGKFSRRQFDDICFPYFSLKIGFFVPHLSFLWCRGKAKLRDCDIFWVSSLIFYPIVD